MTDLKINLSTEHEAVIVLENLPNLEVLNGKSTEDEESESKTEENHLEKEEPITISSFVKDEKENESKAVHTYESAKEEMNDVDAFCKYFEVFI